ncbi:HutD family protein [Pantoea sp.]|uniref:HutD/Ves family protein n=1 Tax=Pantoea sp. TaxID=69393 RepID=UPI002896C620|nr:HutD family protein [Pantoea sp.]
MKGVYRYQNLPVSRWRNGGGETREIISFPPGAADFDWRASIATLAADGPFSRFPGIDRVITLLEGDPVTLSGDNIEQRLAPHQPWAFAGELALYARLSGGRSEDFNIMTRRGRWHAAVEVTARARQSPHGVCWVVAGRWLLDGAQPLQAGEGAWWTDEDGRIAPASAEASLLFVRLSRDL